MLKVTVYGHSDDLIEFEGSIHDELPTQDDFTNLTFSDGTVVYVDYDTEGVWRFDAIAVGPGTTVTLTTAEEGDEGCYTDRLDIEFAAAHTHVWATDGTKTVQSGVR